MHYLHKFSALCLALSLSACVTPPPSPKAAVSADPAALARMQTADAAAIAPPSTPDPSAAQVFLLNDAPIDNPKMVDRLHKIVDRLMQNWTATPVPDVAIYILPDEGYSGDSTGTNQMFVTMGLLERAQSEDEIAFVLAHELSHILLGHINERQNGIRADSKMINMASEGAIAGVVLAHSGEQQLDHGAAGAVLAAFQIGQIIMAANESVGGAGWSRDQEYEADELGFDILVKSQYYNPAAFRPVFERLAEEDKTLAKRRAELKGTVSTALDLLVDYSMGNKNGSTTILNPQQTAELMGTILSSPFAEKIIDRILPASSHPPELDRMDSLQAYATKFWPNALPVDDKPNPFTVGRLGQQTEMVADAIRASTEADADLQSGKIGEIAYLVYQPGMSRDMPLEQKMLRAKLALAEGDPETAQHLLEDVVTDPMAPAVAYMLLAGLQAQSAQTDAALQTLDEGDGRFGSDAPFISYRIALLNRAGRQTDLDKALNTCASFGNQDLLDSCQKAAAPPLLAVHVSS